MNSRKLRKVLEYFAKHGYRQYRPDLQKIVEFEKRWDEYRNIKQLSEYEQRLIWSACYEEFGRGWDLAATHEENTGSYDIEIITEPPNFHSIILEVWRAGNTNDASHKNDYKLCFDDFLNRNMALTTVLSDDERLAKIQIETLQQVFKAGWDFSIKRQAYQKDTLGEIWMITQDDMDITQILHKVIQYNVEWLAMYAVATTDDLARIEFYNEMGYYSPGNYNEDAAKLVTKLIDKAREFENITTTAKAFTLFAFVVGINNLPDELSGLLEDTSPEKLTRFLRLMQDDPKYFNFVFNAYNNYYNKNKSY